MQRQESFRPHSACTREDFCNFYGFRRGSVGWQVDLPGLASLVLNLGTAGLKRFAEAGVDFHTILCMGEIAEQCPASNEYRRELSECRQKQRKQSQWLYKVVEIGAATNFVADELLKRRAGENVVALMSAILPVMSESSCDNLLLKLFEASATPLDKTPGYGQLRCIRETLLPLARKTQFKDKVFQYHSLVRHLLGNSDHAYEMSAYESIPDENTAVNLILAFAKLTQQEKNVIVEYDGRIGAGWVIAYARHVLDLPTCVMTSASTSVSISGDYRNARVILNIFAKEAKCRLLTEGNIQDFITTPCPGTSEVDGWVIDTSRVNVLDSYISQSDPLRKAMIPIARSMVHECTKTLSRSFHKDPGIANESQFVGFTSYDDYCLPAVRRKAQEILVYLGFDPAEAGSVEAGFTPWSRYLEPVGHSDVQTAIIEGRDINNLVRAGPMWIDSNLGRTEACEAYPRVCTETFDKATQRCILLISRMIYAACRLAFTDWDQHLSLISVSFLERSLPARRRITYGISIQNLCQSIIDITVGEQDNFTPKFGEDYLLAFQYRGVVFAQSTALYQNLSLDARYIHVTPGEIAVNGEKKSRIDIQFADLDLRSGERTCIADPEPQVAIYTPADHFPKLHVISRVRLALQGIVLTRNVFTDNGEHFLLPGPGENLRALRSSFVTTPCAHNYYSELNFEALVHDGFFKKAIIRQGILVAANFVMKMRQEVWLQTVDQNPVAQWLATQAIYNQRSLTVIQRDCCMVCVFKRIDAEFTQSKLGNFRLEIVRIVNGRLPGEDLK